MSGRAPQVTPTRQKGPGRPCHAPLVRNGPERVRALKRCEVGSHQVVHVTAAPSVLPPSHPPWGCRAKLHHFLGTVRLTSGYAIDERDRDFLPPNPKRCFIQSRHKRRDIVVLRYGSNQSEPTTRVLIPRCRLAHQCHDLTTSDSALGLKLRGTIRHRTACVPRSGWPSGKRELANTTEWRIRFARVLPHLNTSRTAAVERSWE